ncbi:MAG TPA: hypothetical protein VE033_01315 [Acetobacteraceae bacterium]|jgi:hypothetical protein|nr:hypothetical protein [Acetobacteraceae bacterium]
MEALFSTGRVADLILLTLALEAVLLGAWWRLSGTGVPPRALLPFLAAGACFALALRVALTDGWWGWVAVLLGGAFLAHLLDVGLRWHTHVRRT